MKRRNKDATPPVIKGIFLAAGFITGAIVIQFFFSVITINNDFMAPALKKGDRVLLSRLSSVNRGDIVAYKSPSTEGGFIISRITAGEYDLIEIRDKNIYINNELFQAPWEIHRSDPSVFPMKFSSRDNMSPVKLERNEFFMISDNFDRAYDSRITGPVTVKQITGKMIYKR